MTRTYLTTFAFSTTMAASLIGCGGGTAPSAMRSVNFRVSSPVVSRLSASSAPVALTSLRLVIGPLALGNGDQFGCVDCQGAETSRGPELVSVPVDGTPVKVATEQVAAGHYAAAELELVPPDSRILQSVPAWPATATVEVSGSFNGAPFTLDLGVTGVFRQALVPAVDVTSTSDSLAVVIALPVASWFVDNGTSLDPNNPAQRAQIELNAKRSLQAVEPASMAER